jgi:phosphocarrier protein
MAIGGWNQREFLQIARGGRPDIPAGRKFCLGGCAIRALDSSNRSPPFMAKKEFTILNKLGIHARPAAQFVKMANRFQSDIFVEKDGEEVDGKSIMGLMMLAAGHGSVITVSAEGADAAEALAALEDLISRKFEED